MAPASWSVYMAGKGAMVGVSRSLAVELGPENIRVNMVAPAGWLRTAWTLKVKAPEGVCADHSAPSGTEAPMRSAMRARSLQATWQRTLPASICRSPAGASLRRGMSRFEKSNDRRPPGPNARTRRVRPPADGSAIPAPVRLIYVR